MIVLIVVILSCLIKELSSAHGATDINTNEIFSKRSVMESLSSNDGSGRIRKRSAIYEDHRLWFNGEIPFVFSDDVDKKFRDNILKAMEHFHNNTCIKFLQRSREQLAREQRTSAKPVNHVQFVKHSYSCDSHVGMRGGEQKVNISDRCAGLDSIIHELGHVVGLWHEQSRIDRDVHILIKWNHMNPDYRNNFKKPDQMLWLGPYDLESIMHYDRKMFSDDRGLNVFEPITDLGIDIGRKAHLSYYDSLKINKLYKCAGHCDLINLKCDNAGYLNSLCQCVCPKSIIGSRCHLPASHGVCGKVIELTNQKITIRSPNFPSHYPPNIDCTWIVKAPEGHQILLTLEKYDIACNDTLEIRSHYIGNVQEPRTCLKLAKSDNRSFTSVSNRLLLNFHSDSIGEGVGFEAVVKPIPSPNCASNPCKNGGRCHNISDIETYFCRCDDGWVGKNCDIPINDGQWTQWSAWSGCYAQCGQEHRRRVCEEPLNSGLDCQEGVANESRRCGKNLVQCQGLFHCDFDSNPHSGNCGIVQNLIKDDFDWTRRHFTFNTRDPTGHTTGSRNDSYLAMEGNDGRRWETAVFSLPITSVTTGRYCLQFFHHMSSKHAGMLRVIRQTRKSWQVLWQASGKHPIGWNRAHINVMLHDGVKMHFEGTRGDGADSDVAVDDISLSPLGCYINHNGQKVLRPHPKAHKRIHGCVKNERHFRIGTPITYNETCEQHFCYCNHDGKMDCMVKHMDHCH